MNTLYVTDLDGTFLSNTGELTENSKCIISEAITNGANFTVATARTFATVAQMFEGVNLKLPVILMNGVMIYDIASKKAVSCHSISEESVGKVIDVFKHHNIFPMIYRYKNPYLEIEYYDKSNPYQMQYVGNRTDATGKKFIYSPIFDSEGKNDVIYIVTLDKFEKLLPLYNDLKKINNLSCVCYRDNYTDCNFLEIFAAGVSKASALLEIKELVKADRLIAFGDNLNDIEMFKISDETYAVDNACDELKAIATDVIGSNDNDSVAKFISNHFTENNNE